MKVVDMLGCGLPVLALQFACLDELVQEGRNGLKFSNADGLSDALVSLLSEFPQSDTNSLRSGIALGGAFPAALEGGETWEATWNAVVNPLLDAPLRESDTPTQGPTPVLESDTSLEQLDTSLPSTHGTIATHHLRTDNLRRRSGWNASTTGSSPILPHGLEAGGYVPRISVNEREP